jgi:hypothetical protein
MIRSTASRAGITAPAANSLNADALSFGPRGLSEKGIIREWVGKSETRFL